MVYNKPRASRTTNEQLEILIAYLENHKIMLEMKTHPLKTNEVKLLWEELTNILNNTKKGAKKNVEEWKRFLITWKSKTKNKARSIKQDYTGTGGGPAVSSYLTDFEERLMVLIGWNTVVGCESVAEELVPGQKVIQSLLVEDVILELVEEFDANKQIQAPTIVQKQTDAKETPSQPIVSFESDEQIQASGIILKHTEPEHIAKQTSSRPVVTTPIASNRNRKLSRRKTSTSSESLDNAAKVYMESSQKILQSAELIAASIDKLASAFTKYAEATLAMAEAKKQKYSVKQNS